MNKLTEKKFIKLLILLLSAVYFISYITRINYGAVLVELIADKGISKTAASLAITGSSVTYGLGQLVSGFLGDRIKPQRLITAGLVTTALMNLFLPVLGYKMMIAAWCINGIAQAMMWPPIVKIMSTYLSVDDYKRGSVKISWGSSFGTIAVYLLAPLIIKTSGWENVFYICGISAVVMVAVLMVSYPKIISHATKTASSGNTSYIPSESSLSGRLPVILMLAAAAPGIIFQGILRDGITTWMPTYISDTYKLGSEISILTGVILPVFSILCHQAAATINRRFIKNEFLCAGVIFSLSLAACGILVLSQNQSAALSVILSAIITGCMHGVNLILICMLPPYFAKYGKVSLISGVLNSFTYIGAAISTYGMAFISQHYGWDTTIFSWTIVAFSGAAICLLFSRMWHRFKTQ